LESAAVCFLLPYSTFAVPGVQTRAAHMLDKHYWWSISLSPNQYLKFLFQLGKLGILKLETFNK
jgi:hypothetical protein